MLSSGKYKSILNLEAKYDIFHEILSTFNRKMDFYFTTSHSSFLCFQITWLYNKSAELNNLACTVTSC